MPSPEESQRLWNAVSAASIDSVVVLDALKAGADANFKGDESGVSVLHCAVQKDCAEAVGYLLEYGADVNYVIPLGKPAFGDSALHWAASHGNDSDFEILRLIMEKRPIQARNHGNHLPADSATATNRPNKRIFIDNFNNNMMLEEAQLHEAAKIGDINTLSNILADDKKSKILQLRYPNIS